jgi:hypothetical protein
MSDNKLILHPQNPNIGIKDLEEFITDLREIGLISSNHYIDHIDGKTYFQTGENFLKLIDFIEHRRVLLFDKTGIKEIDANHKDCHIQVSDYGKQVTCHGANMYMQYCRLQCPSCGFEQDVNAAYAVLSKWYENQEIYCWQCEQCARSWHVYELNWHDGFAFARCAIDIWHIHYNEAVPTQPLLKFLQDKTGGSWTYFYYKI